MTTSDRTEITLPPARPTPRPPYEPTRPGVAESTPLAKAVGDLTVAVHQLRLAIEDLERRAAT